MKDSKTYGLTHLALAVRDLNRTKKFYERVFDMQTMYHEQYFLQMTTPGCNDILVFEEKKDTSFGNTGGIAHFGFRLKDPADFGEMIDKIQAAGAIITARGEFVSGSPYVFFKDPDGYQVEVWYELLP
jgi:catechol 2,3-dioxygenase-like lactoylglutathione lyase family enzyme